MNVATTQQIYNITIPNDIQPFQPIFGGVLSIIMKKSVQDQRKDLQPAFRSHFSRTVGFILNFVFKSAIIVQTDKSAVAETKEI